MLVFLYGCGEGGYVSVDVAFGVNAGFSLQLRGGKVHVWEVVTCDI